MDSSAPRHSVPHITRHYTHGNYRSGHILEHSKRTSHTHFVGYARSQCFNYGYWQSRSGAPRVGGGGAGGGGGGAGGARAGAPRGGGAHLGGVGKELTTACVLASTAAAVTHARLVPPHFPLHARWALDGARGAGRVLSRPCNKLTRYLSTRVGGSPYDATG